MRSRRHAGAARAAGRGRASVGSRAGERAPYAHVIADETTADLITAEEVPQWLATPGTAKFLAALAHHTYDFPNDAIRSVVPRAVSHFGIPTWMTEICCYKGSGVGATAQGAQFDPTMTQGFWLADQVYSDLTVARDSAWYWWTALSPMLGCSPSANGLCVGTKNSVGYNDGLLYYDPDYAKNHDYALFPTKRLYVLEQFSKFVRPGAVRHDVTGLPKGTRAMAFVNGKTWSVVVWNEADAPAVFGLTVPGTTTVTDAVSTSPLLSMTNSSRPARSSTGAWLVTLPAQTISTYTFG